jgi:hypothetical protein
VMQVYERSTGDRSKVSSPRDLARAICTMSSYGHIDVQAAILTDLSVLYDVSQPRISRTTSGGSPEKE